MQDDNFTDEDIRRMQEELQQSDARLKEVGGPSTYQAESIMQQVNDRAAGKHTFTKSTDDRSVFVTNLPKGENGYNTTHEDLSNFFSECGQILTLTILTDKKTGQPKGAAYIEFATFEGHGRALDIKQNALFHGNALKVEKKRSLYRPPTGAPIGGATRGRGGMGAGMGGMGGANAAGADAMGAMLAMMMAAAGKMMQQGMPGMGNMMGGGRGGNGGGRGGGRGGGGRGGYNNGGFGGGGFGRGGGGYNGQASNPFGGPAVPSAGGAAPAGGAPAGGAGVFGSAPTAGPFGGGNAGAFGGGNAGAFGGGDANGQPFA